MYFSCMQAHRRIPSFALYGEQEDFPDVVHCEKMSDRAQRHDWIIPKHRHRHLSQVFLIEKGGGFARLEENELPLIDQMFIFVPTHAVHAFHLTEDTKGRVFSFPKNVVTSRPAIETLGRPVSGALDSTLRSLSELLYAAISLQGAYRETRIVALTHALLASIAERQPQAGQPSRLRELDRLILEHCADAWRPADYASSLCITVGHLTRLCQQATGLSASAYIEAATMAEACRMLSFTHLPVAEVGYRLGYADPAYFSRRFRKSQGLPPSSYRARFNAP